MPVTYRDILYHSNGDEWIKTARGWKLKRLEDMEYTPTCERLNPRPDLSNISKQVSLARNVLVTGSKGQRKVSVCLSDFLKYMGIEGAVTDIRRKEYMFDMMHTLVKDNLPKMSGTAHRELFKILEKMCNEALETEYRLDKIKALLQVTLQELFEPGTSCIGAKSVWNKHIQLVENLLTKVEQHKSFEREDDGQLFLTDLPKECLREIMMRLDDHRDIAHFGQTCSDLHELSEDSLMWERLTQRNFTEKQMLTFVYDTKDIDDTLPWKRLYRKCYKKFGIKKRYTDGLVICSACKTLHWMLLGHSCWSSADREAYLDPVTPEDLITMLNL